MQFSNIDELEQFVKLVRQEQQQNAQNPQLVYQQQQQNAQNLQLVHQQQNAQNQHNILHEPEQIRQQRLTQEQMIAQLVEEERRVEEENEKQFWNDLKMNLCGLLFVSGIALTLQWYFKEKKKSKY